MVLLEFTVRILSFDKHRFHLQKKLGLVPNVFEQAELEKMYGSMAVVQTLCHDMIK